MAFMRIKKKIYPRPHDQVLKFKLIPAGTDDTTCIPIIMNDEGKGDPSAYNAHVEHTSFAEANEPNCYPESRINKIFAKFMFSLNKASWVTDNEEMLRFCVIPIYIAFKESYIAIDEKSSDEIQDILNLQTEATDRQGFPLFNGVKISGDVLEVGANVPGLTTNTNLEAVDFDTEKLYDALQYYTNKGKLSSVIGKIKWMQVGRRKATSMRFNIRLSPTVKRMNSYTLCAVIIHVPDSHKPQQYSTGTSFTTATVLNVSYHCRFNEWNENFDMTKV